MERWMGHVTTNRSAWLSPTLLTSPESDFSSPPWGRAASEGRFHICCLQNPSASQWWAVMLTNRSSSRKAQRSPRRNTVDPGICPGFVTSRAEGAEEEPHLSHSFKQAAQENQERVSPTTEGWWGGVWAVNHWLPNSIFTYWEEQACSRENKARNVPFKIPQIGRKSEKTSLWKYKDNE